MPSTQSPRMAQTSSSVRNTWVWLLEVIDAYEKNIRSLMWSFQYSSHSKYDSHTASSACWNSLHLFKRNRECSIILGLSMAIVSLDHDTLLEVSWLCCVQNKWIKNTWMLVLGLGTCLTLRSWYLRHLLMSRSSVPIWKKAFSLAHDVPICPENLSLPAWAHLVFDKFCHVRIIAFIYRLAKAKCLLQSCLASGARHVQWILQIRLYSDCVLVAWVSSTHILDSRLILSSQID